MNVVFVLICFFGPIYGHSIRAATENGILEGTTYTLPNGRDVYAFYGIPFAAPPIGSNRFEPPSPAANWKEPRNATFARSACVQFFFRTSGKKQREGDEDCLYLNVFTPMLPNKKNNDLMNVMVYIHGGGFVLGSGKDVFPDYILQEDNIVFVTINYRLGPLGFLSTQDLVPGNNALKDQVAALKWVQRNIHNFKGDPTKVTIYGNSAGAASVHYQMISPLSYGLFHNAISSSGSVLNPWAYHPKNTKNSIKLAHFMGCPIDDSNLMLKCLKMKPVNHIMEAYERLIDFKVQEKQLRNNSSKKKRGTEETHVHWTERPIIIFGPVIEPNSRLAFLPNHPYDLMKNKHMKHLPWMISAVEREGSFPGIFIVTNDEALKAWNENWNTSASTLLCYNYLNSAFKREELSLKAKQFYFGKKSISGQTTNELLQVIGDRLFYNGIIESAKLSAITNDKNTYCYKFNYQGSESVCDKYGSKDAETNYGACHADDQFYLVKFGNTKSKKNKQDRRMVKFMTRSIIAFMKNGNPNIGSVNWQPIPKNGSMDCLNIYSPSLQKMENIEDLKSSQFWKEALPPEMDYWVDPRGI